jgi:hypothetical protein
MSVVSAGLVLDVCHLVEEYSECGELRYDETAFHVFTQGKSMFTFGAGFSIQAIEIFEPAPLFQPKSVQHPSEVVALALSNHSSEETFSWE